MKLKLNSVFLLCGALLISEFAFAQAKTDRSLTQSKKSVKMDTLRIQADDKEVCFIDKFSVPENSIGEFTQRMNYNRNFIKNLPGFIRDEAYEQKDENGNLTVITIAVWQSPDKVNNAKNAVQAEYKRIGFHPAEFYQRLNITMERGLYKFYREQDGSI